MKIANSKNTMNGFNTTYNIKKLFFFYLKRLFSKWYLQIFYFFIFFANSIIHLVDFLLLYRFWFNLEYLSAEDAILWSKIHFGNFTLASALSVHLFSLSIRRLLGISDERIKKEGIIEHNSNGIETLIITLTPNTSRKEMFISKMLASLFYLFLNFYSVSILVYFTWHCFIWFSFHYEMSNKHLNFISLQNETSVAFIDKISLLKFLLSNIFYSLIFSVDSSIADFYFEEESKLKTFKLLNFIAIIAIIATFTPNSWVGLIFPFFFSIIKTIIFTYLYWIKYEKEDFN